MKMLVKSDNILTVYTYGIQNNLYGEIKHMTIGTQIKNLCEEKGITINALATKSKVPASTLKNIVYGNTKNPGIETIAKICYALEIELCDFFENVEI